MRADRNEQATGQESQRQRDHQAVSDVRFICFHKRQAAMFVVMSTLRARAQGALCMPVTDTGLLR